MFGKAPEEKEARRQARKQAWHARRAAAADRRRLVAEAREQAAGSRNHAAAVQKASQAAARQANEEACMAQLAEDIRAWYHTSPETLNRVMEKTLYRFFPVQPGHYHNWYIDWHWADQVGGGVEFDYVEDKIEMTQAEVQRRQANAQSWQQAIFTSEIVWAINRSNRR